MHGDELDYKLNLIKKKKKRKKEKKKYTSQTKTYEGE